MSYLELLPKHIQDDIKNRVFIEKEYNINQRIKLNNESNEKLLNEVKKLVKCFSCKIDKNEELIVIQNYFWCHDRHYNNSNNKKINVHEKCISQCNFCHAIFCKPCLDKYSYYQIYVKKRINCNYSCHK